MYAPASAGAYKTHSDLMTRIKHLLFALLLAVAVTSPANAFDLPDEDLNYIVLYKWGLINKDAASATPVTAQRRLRLSRAARSSTLPWADKVFRVRDTLQVRIQKSGCLPQVYRKITHEGGHIQSRCSQIFPRRQRGDRTCDTRATEKRWPGDAF